jgi:hypothetical protein
VQLMEVVWILVKIWRMDSFRDEAMCHMQEVHKVDIFQDYASQSIAVPVMSPLWDIITGQRLMMTRVARWML